MFREKRGKMERNCREDTMLEGQRKPRLIQEAPAGRGCCWQGVMEGDWSHLLPVSHRPSSHRHVLLTGCRAIGAICLCPGGFLVMGDASINTRESSKCLEIKKKKIIKKSGGFRRSIRQPLSLCCRGCGKG